MTLLLRLAFFLAPVLALTTLWGVESSDADSYLPPCRGGGNQVRWTPDGSRLLFDIGMALYVVESDGSHLRQISDGWISEDSPAPVWVYQFKPYTGGMHAEPSPDGSRIVYSTCSYLTTEPKYWPLYEIVTSNMDGSEPKRLTENDHDDRFPTWSPDGSRIAFSSNGGPYTMAADGSDARRLAQDVRWESSPPLWSSDGQRLAFTANVNDSGGGRRQVSYTVSPDGSDLTVLARMRGRLSQMAHTRDWLSWSPTDRRVAFVTDHEDGGEALYTADADGSDRILVAVMSDITMPSWSPDGKRIAFVTEYEDGGTTLYTVDADGSDSRLIAAMQYERDSGSWYGQEFRLPPTWSPDGSAILVECATVCVFDPDDGSLIGQSPVRLHGGDVPVWSPDGSRIAVLMKQQRDIPHGSIVLYSMARDGTDMRALVRSGLSLVAENSGWQDEGDARAASCSEGFVVTEPKRNPGLVGDCETLMRLRDAMTGAAHWRSVKGYSDDRTIDVSLKKYILNWSPGVPIQRWTGVTVEDVCGPLSFSWFGRCLAVHPSSGSPWSGYWPAFRPPTPRVTALSFMGLGDDHRFGGTIPPELGDLSELRTLELLGAYGYRTEMRIPPELGKLRKLQHLKLDGGGVIPPSLGRLTDLRSLHLRGKFNGIPPELGSLTNLRGLSLQGYYLTGVIPPELGRLSNLQRLELGGTAISGVIPPELGRLTNLQRLDLGNTAISGSIPPELGMLSNLQILDLNDTAISGSIPPEMGKLTDLQVLDLSGSELTGAIPPELGNLTNLWELSLQYNQLTGKVPPELGSIPGLEKLVLWGNSFECLPAELKYRAELKYKQDLRIDSNDEVCTADSYTFEVGEGAAVGSVVGVARSTDVDTVSYSITAGNEEGKFAIEADSGLITLEEPLDFDRTPSYTLVVERSDEDRSMSPATVTVSVISLLDLCSQGIAVLEPDDNPGLVSDCVTLLRLSESLGVNKATLLQWRAGVPITSWAGVSVGGSPSRVQDLDLDSWYERDVSNIPPALDGLTALRGLDLSGRGFTGEIPPELGNLTELRRLSLSSNELTGEIPPELGNLTELRSLSLYNNELTGEIPPELGNLTELRSLSLYNNELTGEIPAELGNLHNVRYLSLDTNQLIGEIPPELGNLSELRNIDLSGNRLTGEIPPELGNLSELRDIDLSGNWLNIGGNQLTGEIPPELGNLSELRDIDLSSNRLTGEIPPELGSLSKLRRLNIGGNQLTGCIPPALRAVEESDLDELGLPYCE